LGQSLIILSDNLGAMKQIPVAMLEFVEDGNTLWVHSPQGGTVLRIKTKGKITTRKCPSGFISHADIMTEDDIEICLGEDQE